jgi:hypothetical protein
VEGGHRRHDSAAEPRDDPLTQLGCGAAAERQGEDGVRGQRIVRVGQPRADRLDDRGGLARARAGQHEQRT